jgi:PAS domain-containing protein
VSPSRPSFDQTIYATVFQHAPVGIEVYDAEGTLVEANAECLRIFGVADESRRFAKVGLSVTRGISISSSWPRGGTISLEVRIAPLREPAPAGISGYVALIQDISPFKAIEASLRDERWRLASTIEGTRAGTWEWNVQTGETAFNSLWAETLGYTLEELAPVSIDTWGSLTHPEDLERSNAAFLQKPFSLGELAAKVRRVLDS